MSKPRPITELLAGKVADPVLQTIQRGKKLQQLSRWVQNMLVPELASHCQVLNIRGNTLILGTDATVWATRLRYQLPSLLRDLQQHPGLEQLNDIQIRVQPASIPPAGRSAKRRPTLSADSSHCLQQCADTIDDIALSRALQRLAGRRRD
jgi:hypothetical protein